MADLKVHAVTGSIPQRPLNFYVVDHGAVVGVLSYEEVKSALDYFDAMQRTWEEGKAYG